MEEASEDEAWVEAELQRQLAAEDGQQADDADDHRAEADAAGGESSAMAQFRQLMEQMEMWGKTAADHIEEALLETTAAASNAERELQERPPPPELPQVGPPAPDGTLSALELELHFEDPPSSAPSVATAEEAAAFLAELAQQARAAALAQLEQRSIQEGEPSSVDLNGGPAEVRGAHLGAGGFKADTVEENAEGTPRIRSEQLDEGDEASFDAIERRIEAERLACLQLLERQHQELMEQMQREEEERRKEEACLKEQLWMHTEELMCREFYSEERQAQRRESRRMRMEDKLSRHVQEEEQRMKEDAERAREAVERGRLEREDQWSTAVRRRAHEQREGHAMALEESQSDAWRCRLRFEWENSCLANADAESRRCRDRAKEAEECKSMAREDQYSSMQRMCQASFKPRSPALEKSAAQTSGVLVPLRPLPASSDLSILAKMVLPIPQQPGSPPRKGELNPWDSAPSSRRRASKAKEVHTCGNAICMKLAEGAKRKRGRLATVTATRRPERSSFTRRPSGGPPGTWKNTDGGPRVTADLGLELAGGLEDWLVGPATSVVRLEVRMEGLESLPQLSCLTQLRALVLSGNKIHGSLEALEHCPHLEELDLCQNSLTSLDGLRYLKYLSVLKATMNEISDAEDLAQLPNLRVVDLSKNRLTAVPLTAPVLAKLILYRNLLDSTGFLRALPSLIQLDLGRNKLTELDQISEWNPLLTKIFLYENRLASLPELHLPLLTDLWVDNNHLEVLGPLGFLPSLERLQAKHNRIRSVAQPVAASPLLKTLELAFNQLEMAEIPKAVLPLRRLTRLQLNDNPAVAELMEDYRPWVLRMVPHLEELDNETVMEVERRSPEPWVSGFAGMGRAVARSVAEVKHREPALSRGLLGLVAPKSQIARPEMERMDCEGVDRCHPSTTAKEALLERWKAAWAGPGPTPNADESGCQMCALASWCEALNAARSVPLVVHTREERRTAALWASNAGRHDDALFALQRRHDFWNAFLQLCAAQYESLCSWPRTQTVCRSSVFELQIPGAEISRQELLRKVQSRWRGLRARRRVQALRLERWCQALSSSQVSGLVKLQASWRGARQREVLRKMGYVLPSDRRLAEYGRAATQLQAALRGSRLRQKLRWAKEVSKMTSDEMEDCPAVDLDELLDDARRVAEADPFGFLSLPKAVPAARITPDLPAKPAAPQGQPMAAWGTPPSTAAGERTPEEAPRGGIPDSPASRPQSGRGASAGCRRSRSMSSTAESAMTEEGHGRNRAEQAKEEWGFKDLSTARNYLKAQRRRQPRPPPIPGGGSSSRSALTPTHAGPRKFATAARGGDARGDGGLPNAQEAIKEYKRQQEAEAAERDGAGTVEFRSGSPNRKLMRSSKSLS